MVPLAPEVLQVPQVPPAHRVSRVCEASQETQAQAVPQDLLDHEECPVSLGRMVRMVMTALLVLPEQLVLPAPVVCPACPVCQE